MTIQDVVIHTSEGLSNAPMPLRQSSPPITCRFELANDLWVEKLNQKVAEKVLDSCEPASRGVPRPKRRFEQLYAFVRDLADQADMYNWDSDKRL